MIYYCDKEKREYYINPNYVVYIKCDRDNLTLRLFFDTDKHFTLDFSHDKIGYFTFLERITR